MWPSWRGKFILFVDRVKNSPVLTWQQGILSGQMMAGKSVA